MSRILGTGMTRTERNRLANLARQRAARDLIAKYAGVYARLLHKRRHELDTPHVHRNGGKHVRTPSTD